LVKEAQADESAGEVQETQHRSGVSVEAHGELAERDDPGLRTLHNPAVTTQSFAGLHAAPSDPRDDPTLSPGSPRSPEVISLVGVQLGRSFAGAPRRADRPTDRLDGIHQRLQELRIVHLGGCELA
jgi:hypothetical protein